MSIEFVKEYYYVICIVILLGAFLLFVRGFESRKPGAREVVILAVMSAIAVASRAVFVMIPFVKPILGIIMITGIAFGVEAGFLTGAVSALVSNFIFGQGPWTPWQMFAYGLAGAIAGFLAKRKIMGQDRLLLTSFLGYVIVQFIVGPVLDCSSLLLMGRTLSKEFVFAIFTAGATPNGILGIATGVTLLLLCKPMVGKLNRLKIKYGIMEADAKE